MLVEVANIGNTLEFQNKIQGKPSRPLTLLLGFYSSVNIFIAYIKPNPVTPTSLRSVDICFMFIV